MTVGQGRVAERTSSRTTPRGSVESSRGLARARPGLWLLAEARPDRGPVDRERATHLSKISTRASRRLPVGETRTGGCCGSRRVTHFDPLVSLRLRLSLPMLRAAGKSLMLPGSRERALRRRFLRAPSPVAQAHRVTGEHEQRTKKHLRSMTSVRRRRRRRWAPPRQCRSPRTRGVPGPG